MDMPRMRKLLAPGAVDAALVVSPACGKPLSRRGTA